jgi:hypothetical protein
MPWTLKTYHTDLERRVGDSTLINRVERGGREDRRPALARSFGPALEFAPTMLVSV